MSCFAAWSFMFNSVFQVFLAKVAKDCRLHSKIPSSPKSKGQSILGAMPILRKYELFFTHLSFLLVSAACAFPHRVYVITLAAPACCSV